MDVGLLFSFLRKFWEIVQVHLITLSSVLHSHNIQFSTEGRCRSAPKCPKVLGARRGEGGMDAGLLFKAGNDLFGRSISGQQKVI